MIEAGFVEVVAPGLLSTIQDRRGRPDAMRYGVPVGGALDALAAAAANQLLGNRLEAAVVEVTLAGPELRFTASTSFAVAGADLGAELDGRPVPPGWSWLARRGSTLRFAMRATGARAYVAVAGGFHVPAVLGSSSTDLRAGLPGLAGRPLRAGDRLPYRSASSPISLSGRYLAPARITAGDLQTPARVLPGPHADRFRPTALDVFCGQAWVVGAQADRMGYRLLGPPLGHVGGADVASLGLPTGAVQVPGDGTPIVLLADHQPTGGYTVLACVIRADIRLLAQRAAGDTIRFALATADEARAALRAQRESLAAVVDDRSRDQLRLVR